MRGVMKIYSLMLHNCMIIIFKQVKCNCWLVRYCCERNQEAKEYLVNQATVKAGDSCSPQTIKREFLSILFSL